MAQKFWREKDAWHLSWHIAEFENQQKNTIHQIRGHDVLSSWWYYKITWRGNHRQTFIEMENLKRLSGLIHKVNLDKRLKPIHLSMYMALCDCWIKSQFKTSYNISRRQLMMASRIQSTATYHRIISDLQNFRYIIYKPSYHPVRGSQVILVHDCLRAPINS